MRHCGAIPRRYFTRSTCSNGCCQSPPSWTFAPNLTNSACRGSPHGRTETFGTSSIQQYVLGQQTEQPCEHGEKAHNHERNISDPRPLAQRILSCFQCRRALGLGRSHLLELL